MLCVRRVTRRKNGNNKGVTGQHLVGDVSLQALNFKVATEEATASIALVLVFVPPVKCPHRHFP